MSINRKATVQVVKYALLPQILPRLAELFVGGFAYFSFFMAQVFRGVRLLPEGHPYLNAANVGSFSIIDVIGTAGRNVIYRRENIDQIIMFYMILTGLFIFGLQAFTLLISLFSPQVMAFTFEEFFGTNNDVAFGTGYDESQDIAFILLDRVFGIPEIFNSCVDPLIGVDCYRAAPDLSNSATVGYDTVYTPAVFPWPFHEAMHALFEFYSYGLLLIACMIFLYFVVVIVAETAQTGTPFGKRFNKVWAPLRLVVAFGLLIPIGYGLNSAQYIVLYAAKVGSNFATNGWLKFNDTLAGELPFDGMVATPQTQDVSGIIGFMMLAHACKAIEEGMISPTQNSIANPNWTPEPLANCNVSNTMQDKTEIDGYLVIVTGDAATDSLVLSDTDYDGALAHFENNDFVIRFGDKGCTNAHKQSSGHVFPTCGEIAFTNATLSSTDAGAKIIQEGYYNLIKNLWGTYYDGSNTRAWTNWGFCNTDGGAEYDNMVNSTGGDTELKAAALFNVWLQCPADKMVGHSAPFPAPDLEFLQGITANYLYGDLASDPGAPGFIPPLAAYPTSPASGINIVTNFVRDGVDEENTAIASGKYLIPDEHLIRGWAGAGMWYNHIARVNGAISGASWNVPTVTKFPSVMEAVGKAKMRNNQNISAAETYNPSKSQDSSLQLRRGEADMKGAVVYNNIYQSWLKVDSEFKPQTGNVFYDGLNKLFGTRGLFDLRAPENQNVHPLALMTALGKGLVEASIRNLIGAMIGDGVRILSSVDSRFAAIPQAASVASNILYSVATMTLAAGFILYYVLPFLPFIYFFFAVGNWIKGVFEAMVGVPLWALAHIRIDGDGLPGSAALSGYFLIFEIFLRPILILFGLLASISIFAAMASTLNAVFPIAVNNLGGLDFNKTSDAEWLAFARGPVDQLFYTIMYAVILYIMATSSFKMIDLIPQQILRWMGSSATGFSDGSNAEQLTQYAAIGGTQVTRGAIGGIQQMGTGAAQAVSAFGAKKGP